MVTIEPKKKGDNERILAMGGPGSGKTTGWFRAVEHGSGIGYVLDTDRTTQRFLSSKEFEHLEDRLVIHTPTEWPQFTGKVKEWLKVATPDDWLVIDMASEAWNSVQDYFCWVVYGKTRGEMALEHRAKVIQDQQGKGKPNPFDGLSDYAGTINPMYREWQADVLRWPGHIYLATGASKIIDGVDRDRDILNIFGKYGVKPEGQKHLGYIANSVLLFAQSRRGFLLTSVKDRQREQVEGLEMSNFAWDYLVGVGGWQVKA